MNASDDNGALKEFLQRGQAAQAAVDQVIADNHRATLAEVLERLSSAALFSVPPIPSPNRPQLGDLFADAIGAVLAEVPAKKRAAVSRQLARLERSIRSELELAFTEALAQGNRVAGAGGSDATRWAYQAGTLNGLILVFLGSRSRGGAR